MAVTDCCCGLFSLRKGVYIIGSFYMVAPVFGLIATALAYATGYDYLEYIVYNTFCFLTLLFLLIALQVTLIAGTLKKNTCMITTWIFIEIFFSAIKVLACARMLYVIHINLQYDEQLFIKEHGKKALDTESVIIITLYFLYTSIGVYFIVVVFTYRDQLLRENYDQRTRQPQTMVVEFVPIPLNFDDELHFKTTHGAYLSPADYQASAYLSYPPGYSAFPQTSQFNYNPNPPAYQNPPAYPGT